MAPPDAASPTVTEPDTATGDRPGLPDRVRRFAAELAAGATERDRRGGITPDVFRALSASGALDLGPGRADGSEFPPSVILDAARSIAVADPSVAQIIQNHYAALGSVLYLDFDAAVRRELRQAVSDGALLATAAAERTGANSLEVSTRITGAPGGFRIDGTKYYCTGSAGAAWFFVTAVDDRGIRQRAIVAADAPGVAVLDDWDAVGQRATSSGSVVLDGVVVGSGRVAPYVSSSDRAAYSAVAIGIHAAIEVGIARGALEDARLFLREGARPWPDADVVHAADDPLVLRRIGALVGRVHAAEALFGRAAGLLDEASPPAGAAAGDPAALSAARVALVEVRAFAARTALDVASELFAVGGAAAARSGLGLDRHWRNTRTHSLQVPVDWADHAVGNHFVNGAALPAHGRL